MCTSQSELASPPPPVRNRMKILFSDWVFDDQEESAKCYAEGTKKDNVIEEDAEFIPS